MDIVASFYRALSAGDGRAAARAVPPANATGLPFAKDRCHAVTVHAANRMPLSHFVQSRSTGSKRHTAIEPHARRAA